MIPESPDGQSLGLEGGGLGLPPVWTYSSVLSSAWHTFWHDRFDEARRKSREDAAILENDCALQGMMQERKLAVSCLPWHLEIPDERDRYQVFVRDKITQVLKRFRKLRDFVWCELGAIWKGRAGCQVAWGWGHDNDGDYLFPRKFAPVDGDKIGHQHDGTPYVLIWGPARQQLERFGGTIITTTLSQSLLLSGPWRELFVIHHHELEDADWWDADRAEAMFGIGVRSKIMWLNWIRLEWMANVTDYMERVGLGLTIWYYNSGDPAAKTQAEKAAKEQSGRVNLLWPRDGSGKQGSGVERVEVPTTGAQALVELQKWILQLEERFIIGQTLSSGTEGNGLGGTGVADLHADTKSKIAAMDAARLEATLTGDDEEPGLVSMIQKYTFPDSYPTSKSGFPVTWKFDVERSESAQKTTAASSIWSMGVTLKADEVRAAAGFSKPQEGDEIVKHPPAPGSAVSPADLAKQTPQDESVKHALAWAEVLGDSPSERSIFAAAADMKAIGLVLCYADEGWQVYDAQDFETEPGQFAATRAPKGGVSVGGKFYRGGQWIPDQGGGAPAAGAKPKATKPKTPRKKPKLAKPPSLKERLERIRLVDAHSGVKYLDRIINGMLERYGVIDTSEYRGALRDVLRKGDEARPESKRYLRLVREDMENRLLTGTADEQKLRHVLSGIREEGHGDLTVDELRDYLMGQSSEPKVVRTRGKKKPPKKPITGEPADYLDQVIKIPFAERLKEIKEKEKKTGETFVASFINRLTSHPEFSLPGQDQYQETLSRVLAGENLPESRLKVLDNYRRSVLAWLQSDDADQQLVGDILEQMAQGRQGALRVDEFLDMAGKVDPLKRAAYSRKGESLKYSWTNGVHSGQMR